MKTIELGTLSSTNYWTSSLTDSVISVGTIAASASVGNWANGIAGGGLKGIAADSMASGTLYTLTQSAGEVVTYNLTDGQTGKSLHKKLGEFSLSGSVTQLGSDTLTDIGISAFAGLLGRIPKSNHKIIWTAPSLSNPTPFKIVQPDIQLDTRRLRGSLADSTGGNIYNNAGGQIVMAHSGKRIDIPKASSSNYDVAIEWMKSIGSKIKSYVNPNASVLEQAKQAVDLQKSIIEATRNSIIDGNAANYTSVFQSVKTFDDLQIELVKQGFSGTPLYNKIIDNAIENTQFIGCFIAGTLVGVQRDLNLPRIFWKNIEDIQVGDLVLSRPEDGTDIQEYKPVVNTFKLEKKPILALEVSEVVDDIQSLGSGSHTIIATANHPFWVCGWASVSGELDSLELDDKGKWCRLDELMDGCVIQSRDKYYVVHFVTPLYQTEQPHIAWAMDPENIADESGWKFNLEEIKQSGQIIGRSSYNTYYQENMHGEREYEPYLADVYNFEVQDYHTYYVSGANLWVHNTNCGVTIASNNKVPLTGQDVLQKMEKTAKNIYTSSDQMMKDLPDDLHGVAIVKDIEVKPSPKGPNTTSASQGQQMGYGALSQIDPITGKELLYALSFGYPNPFINGKNVINRGDVIVYADINGSQVPTNMSGDIKWNSTYGYQTGAVYDYVNNNINNWKKELNELSAKDPNTLAIADEKRMVELDEKISDALKRNSALLNDLLRTTNSIDYYGGNYQHAIIPTVAKGELSTQRSRDLANAFAKMATDPAIKNTIDQLEFNQANLAKYGNKWSKEN